MTMRAICKAEHNKLTALWPVLRRNLIGAVVAHFCGELSGQEKYLALEGWARCGCWELYNEVRSGAP